MYNYLALGDSITVGVGAPHRFGYVNILASYLRNIHPIVYTKKIARNGWKSEDLLSAIYKNSLNQQYISTANLITLYIGGNNLSFAFIKARLSKSPRPLFEAISRFAVQFNYLIQIIQTHTQAPLLTATLYNPFPNSPLASQFIHQINHVITSISQANSVPTANVFDAFLGKEYALVDGYCDGKLENFVPLLQKNPIHPNQWGHKVIADVFWQTLMQQAVNPQIINN